VTSQSPDGSKAGKEETDPYLAAWEAMSHMVMEQGASWSGREKNCSFLNLGNGQFANVSGSTDADFPDDARAVALMDWDNDGALDLVLKNRTAPRLRLMRNQAGAGQSWLGLKLTGTGMSNRDAIGAKVQVTTASGRKLHRSLYAGDSYLSQSTKTLHFGLGGEGGKTQVYVVWPDGSQQSFTDVVPGSVYQLTQGKQQVEAIAQQKIERFATLDPAPLAVDSSSSRRAVLVDRLPLAAMPLPSYDNPQRIVNSLAGKPLLINLWGTTCSNCLKELNDFHEHAAEIEALGLTIVPMCSDEMTAGAKAQNLVAGMGFDGQIAGPTDERWLGMVQMVFLEIFGPNAPSVLPTSLLLDPHGRVCVVYQGPVSLETLTADVERLKNSPLDNRFTGILTGGQWLARRFRDFPGLAGAMRQNGYPLMADFFEQIATQTGQKPR
jgi:hypothetical protein